MPGQRAFWLLLCGAALAACGKAPERVSGEPAATKAAPLAKKKHHRTRKPVAERAPPPSDEPAAEPGAKAEPEAAPSCPDDMALVKGNFCRAVEERCLRYVSAHDGGRDENRCLEFEKPTKCVSTAPEPRHMAYCMDRYEFPNKPGELPMTLVSWTDAARACQSEGKRLCTESEFTFACEGEAMQPYAYGFDRDAKKCNIDKPYQTPKGHLLPYAQCEANASCAAELERVDGREPIGSHPECVSPFGIYDMNGNANEWVSQPWKNSPHRAAIKGGWWGPVRNRCRAITLAHDETYLGYEVGFRCCKDVPASGDAGVSAEPDKAE